MMVATRFALIVCLVCAVPAAAHAVQCQAPGGFDAWLASFKQEAAAQGISQRTITTALAGVTYDPNVVARDRKQGVFNQSFEEFSGRMVPPRLNRGANMLRQYAGTLTRIEQQFGVPGSVLIAIWGLETVGKRGRCAFHILGLQHQSGGRSSRPSGSTIEKRLGPTPLALTIAGRPRGRGHRMKRRALVAALGGASRKTAKSMNRRLRFNRY